METPPRSELFEKIQRLANSKLENHQHVHALLTVVTSIIQQKGGPLNATSYFGILLQLLTESADELAAIVTLLSITLPMLPTAVVQMRYPAITKPLLQSLEKNQDNAPVLRAVLPCFGVLLLRHQATWDASLQQQMHALLTFSLDSRPKVRKAAQKAVQTAMKEGGTFIHKHAIPPMLALCNQVLSKGQGDPQLVLHLLGLLEGVLSLVPQAQMATFIELLVKLPAYGNALISLHTLNCFKAIFATPHEDLNGNFLVQSIVTLAEMQPNPSDVAASLSFTKTVTGAVLALQEVDPELCRKHLTVVVRALMSNFLCEKQEVLTVAYESLQRLFEACIDTVLIESTAAMLSTRKTSLPLENVIAVVEGGLRFPYRAAWNHVLRLAGLLITKIGKKLHELLPSLILHLAELYDTRGFPFRGDLENTFGAAIATLGPRIFLTYLPLGLDQQPSPTPMRLWLMPLLRAHIRNTELSFFGSYFLPLARRLKERSLALAQAGKGIEAKENSILYYQVWALFPSFCVMPTDAAVAFKGLARLLGSALEEDSHLHAPISTGLSQLIDNNKYVADGHTEQSDDAVKEAKTNVEAFASFARNFLPCLFNVFGATSAENRPAVIKAIEAYVSITEASILNNFFKNVLARLITAAKSDPGAAMETDEAATKAKETTQVLTELCCAFVRQLDAESVRVLIATIEPQLKQDENATLQKKSFKVLAAVCEHQGAFVQAHLERFKALLVDTLMECSGSAKKMRLRSLLHVVSHLGKKELPKFTLAILGDLLLCCKEVSLKARAAAFTVLVAIGNRFAFHALPMSEFFTMVVGGLGGSTPHMMSATVLALSRLFYQFHGLLSPEFIGQLLTSGLVMLKFKAREVVKSTLGFVMVSLSLLPLPAMQQHLPALCEGLFHWAHDSHNPFRLKIRVVLERLLRKFGYDEVAKHVPHDDLKILKAIRQSKKRKQKKKDNKDNKDKKSDDAGFEQAIEGSDIEPDEDEGGAEEMVMGKKETADGTWIMEDGDEPIDFLGSAASSRVSATDPKRFAARAPRTSFPVGEDGKLIIEEPDMDKGGSDDEPAERGGFGRKGSKRSLGSDDETAPGQVATPPPGGRRILNTKKQRGENEWKYTGKEYKAKRGDAGGDVKGKSRMEPFAYLPLNKKNLNKRRKSKAMSQIKKVVRSGNNKGKGQRK